MTRLFVEQPLRSPGSAKYWDESHFLVPSYQKVYYISTTRGSVYELCHRTGSVTEVDEIE